MPDKPFLLDSDGDGLRMINLALVKVAYLRADLSIELQLEGSQIIRITDPDKAFRVSVALSKLCDHTTLKESISKSLTTLWPNSQ